MKLDETQLSDIRAGFDPMTCVLPCGYHSTVVNNLYDVLWDMQKEYPWYEDIALGPGLDKMYVHFILEVFAANDLIEYGCSPRGAWLNKNGKDLLSMATSWRFSGAKDEREQKNISYEILDKVH